MTSSNTSCSFLYVVAILILTVSMVYGKDCTGPIGIEKGNIPDEKVSASSSYDDLSAASRGRLNIKYQPPNKSGWCAKEINQQQYLEIDLEADSEITGVATQGRGREPYKHWVSKYYVSFRTQDGPWFNFSKPGQSRAEVFLGNNDAFTTVFHSFNRVIKARYVRIHPVEWNIQICMRVELYGCLGDKLVINDDDLLIMFIILLALAFFFVLLLLILLLTMRRLLKLLERRLAEKVRVGIELRDSIDGERKPRMNRSPGDTYIAEEHKQGTSTQTRGMDIAYKDSEKGDVPLYATIQKSKKKSDEDDYVDDSDSKDKGKKKNGRKKYKDASEPKTILVHADEEEEKRKSAKKEKFEMIDL